MEKKLTTLFFTVTICVSMCCAQNEKDVKLVTKEQLETEKNVFFTQKIGLTPKQAPLFWSLYNEYKTAEANLYKKELSIRKKVWQNNLRDEEYEQAIKSLFEIEYERCELRVNFYKKTTTILTPKQKLMLYDTAKQYRNNLLQRINTQKED